MDLGSVHLFPTLCSNTYIASRGNVRVLDLVTGAGALHTFDRWMCHRLLSSDSRKPFLASKVWLHGPRSGIATTRSQLYPHRLKSGHIRLLRIEPSLGACFFETHALEDAPEFIAISYSWQSSRSKYSSSYQDGYQGATLDRPRIELEMATSVDTNASEYAEACLASINGKEYEVSQSTYDIIKRANYNDTVARLWLDSLCINQADVLERNAQVSMMGEIYSAASNVAVWLGWDDHGETETVMEVCKSVQSEYNWLRDEPSDMPKIVSLMDASVRQKFGLSSLSDEKWATFGRFWNLPWFHRTWVVQEASLGFDRSRFFWGATELDADMLYDVSMFLVEAETGLSVEQDFDSCGSKPFDWFTLGRRLGTTLAKARALNLIINHLPSDGMLHDSFWRKCEDLGGLASLNNDDSAQCIRLWTHMLEVFRSFDATDPRDHVYSSLALIKAAATKHGWPSPAVIVDYHRTVPQVYADAVKCIMEAGDCVNILCLAQDPSSRNQSNLPSWVPNFSAGTEMPILMGKPSRRRVMSKLYSLSQTYSMKSETPFHIEDSLQILSLRVLRLDKVVAVGESHYELANRGLWEQTGQILLARESFAEVPQESRIESLWRTMLANTGYQEEDIASADTASDFKCFMIASLIRNMAYDPNHLDKSPSWWRLVDEEIEKHGACGYILTREEAVTWAAEADRRWRAIDAGGQLPDYTPKAAGAIRFAWSTEAMFYRRIILTEGGYLGIAPISTRPGDEVWVMPDAPLPVVLSKVTSGPDHLKGSVRDRYVLLGETYSHGNPNFERSSEWCWIELQ